MTNKISDFQVDHSLHRRQFLRKLALVAGLFVTGEALVACGDTATSITALSTTISPSGGTTSVAVTSTNATTSMPVTANPDAADDTPNAGTANPNTTTGTPNAGTAPATASYTNVGQVDSFKQVVAPKAISMDGVKGFVYYKDNQLYVFSDVCTHLGCEVQYDTKDKEFECPCHGSLYDLTGAVKHGPAKDRLPYFEYKIENGDLLIKLT